MAQLSDTPKQPKVVAKEAQPPVAAEPIPQPALQPTPPAAATRNTANIYWALALIGVGIMFLLHNFGLLPWTVWVTLWQFWPLILVVIGLRLILGSSRWATWIVAVVAIVLLIGALAFSITLAKQSWYDQLRQQVPWLPAAVQSDNGEIHTETISSSRYSSAQSLQIEAETNAADFRLSDTDGSNIAVVKTTGMEGAGVSAELRNTVLYLTLQDESSSVWQWGGLRREQEVVLGRPDLPTSLNLEVNAGRGRVELDETSVTAAVLKVAAGSLDADLGQFANTSTAIELDVDAGRAELTLPKDVGLKVEYAVDLGRLEVNSQSLRDDGEYVSENYETASRRVTVKVSVGAGSVMIGQ